MMVISRILCQALTARNCLIGVVLCVLASSAMAAPPTGYTPYQPHGSEEGYRTPQQGQAYQPTQGYRQQPQAYQQPQQQPQSYQQTQPMPAYGQSQPPQRYQAAPSQQRYQQRPQYQQPAYPQQNQQGGPHRPRAQARPQPQHPAYATPNQRGPYRLAERADVGPAKSSPSDFGRQGNEHPLMPALRWAEDGLKRIQGIKDYSATIVKRERIGGEVGDHQYMFIKVRHKPFSVYMFFLGPPKLRGQEVIYVEGQNDGNMWAHPNGIKNTIVGTVSLSPTGMIAMQGQRYPITELGIQNLVVRLLEVGSHDTQYGECEVEFIEGAKINGRTCTCIQVMHPVPRRNFLFHLARIFVDDELNVPIRYEAYDWPKEEGGEPQLIEEYTYLNLKLNNGFTDADFDIRNPNYQFRSR